MIPDALAGTPFGTALTLANTVPLGRDDYYLMDTPFGTALIVCVAIVVFLVLLGGESVADAQMLRFQKNKQRLRDAGLEVEKPFMDGGLFRFSRHPNYFCEMGMWLTFYLFAISASNQVVHWTGLGFLLLIALFQGSINLTEEISGGKYPGYSEYQAAVPRVVPIPLRKLVGR